MRAAESERRSLDRAKRVAIWDQGLDSRSIPGVERRARLEQHRSRAPRSAHAVAWEQADRLLGCSPGGSSRELEQRASTAEPSGSDADSSGDSRAWLVLQHRGGTPTEQSRATRSAHRVLPKSQARPVIMPACSSCQR
jgi:hypothetical protein